MLHRFGPRAMKEAALSVSAAEASHMIAASSEEQSQRTPCPVAL